MRSKLMTLAVVVAGVVLAAPTAIAAEDAVQEQLRLMEQRMAEMEDRLQATSEELDSAKTTVEEQQEMLSDAGLVDDDRGVRSGVGAFFEAVDVSGVAAASYNYRFIDGGDADGLGNTTGLSDPNSFGNTPNGGASNDSFFTHRNSDTFQIDQVWMTLDKTPTEESRAGFHVDLVWGETAESQSSGSRDTGLLYTGYVSYLAPIGDGVQFDAGKLATTLGAEVLQANQNFNVTNGAVFQTLQPFTHTGVTATTDLGDGIALVVGVVNEVYRDTNISTDRNKAYIGQVQIAGDSFGLNVGAIVGENPTAVRCDNSETDCNSSVFDVTMTVAPTDNLEAWINLDWVRHFGSDVKDADQVGIAAASRLAITDDTGIAGRVEYMWQEATAFTTGGPGGGDDRELLTLTGTVDHQLAEGLKIRGELRYDRELEEDANRFSSGDQDQLVGLAEIYYEF
ncbi:MAG: outer membrane beta-barrel protein [Deltaproteobacteria bacterium]|nr:outer membrane beta-barrel protein [Deltaproteobacteria bacterium]